MLRCVITLTEDRAFEKAHAADAEIRRGKYRGPLHGIPWGAKDLLAVRGYKTTWGAGPFKDQTIDADATVVQRLDAAGAVLVGWGAVTVPSIHNAVKIAETMKPVAWMAGASLVSWLIVSGVAGGPRFAGRYPRG